PRRRRLPRRGAALHAAPPRGQYGRGRPLARARGGVGETGDPRRAGVDRPAGLPARLDRPCAWARRGDARHPPGALLCRPPHPVGAPRIPRGRRGARWPVPVALRRGALDGPSVPRLLADKPAQTVTLADAARLEWYFGNADAGGFYRVAHDPAARTALLAHLDALTPVERLALAGDQWAFVRAAKATIETFLELANALGEETDYDVLDGISGPLDLIDGPGAAPGSAVQEQLRGWIAARFGPQLERLGWEAAPGEDDPTRLRRAAIVRLVGSVAEAPAILAEARRRLDAYLG